MDTTAGQNQNQGRDRDRDRERRDNNANDDDSNNNDDSSSSSDAKKRQQVKRKKSSTGTTVLERIFKECGMNQIKQYYTDALAKSVDAPLNFNSLDAFKPIYDIMIEHAYETDRLVDLPTIEQAHTAYRSQVKSIMLIRGQCKVHTGQFQAGYPVVSIRSKESSSSSSSSSSSGVSSMKLQLHQLPHFFRVTGDLELPPP